MKRFSENDQKICIEKKLREHFSPVKDWQPDHALRLLLHPVEEVEGLDQVGVPGLLEAGPHTGLHVDASEGLGLAKDPGDLDTVTEQEAKLPLV